MNRADFLRLAAGAALGLLFGGGPASGEGMGGDQMKPISMQRRPIPASGESLPVIGLGTYKVFDVAPGSAEYARLPAVLAALFAAGGSVIDSSPMYGRAEETTGELLAAAGSRSRAFVASKVWIEGREAGRRQMEASLRLLRAEPLDLMQVHNLVDWRDQLATLREWKAAGRIRHLGVTHYHAGAYDALAAVLRAERLDFVQINYSLDEREAERLILPLAAERGVAVLINRPFGGGGLLRRLRDKPLPPWAAEIGAGSWAQLLLKFVLSQPAVSCAIPGTGKPEHMADNAAAGCGMIPEPAFWQRHAEVFSL
ncbi:MAG: aldo/keto reductase [Betaproteobacteria bacterium]|nr:aldo/keto reductase [Betaproteobacteria bacterium]MCL2886060.1 aldo/keto reductase [Betaproteobacteria bacterium]